MSGILARKLEMTRIIKNDTFIPITLLSLLDMRVVGYKTQEKDGYSTIIVGVVKNNIPDTEILWDMNGKTTLSKNKFSLLREFPIDVSMEGKKELGSLIGYDEINELSEVRISGISKWRWFTGAMKQHNFSGGPKTHGSKFHRALGSIWNRKPTRTHKGKKMHWHMGCERVTLNWVKVELVNKDIGIVWVRWAIPGARNSLVEIYFNN